MLPGETILSGAPSHQDDPCVSEFKVMRSYNGFYIGTTYEECSFHGEYYEVPNTRETDYFAMREEAEVALEVYHTTGVMPKQRR